MSGLEARPVRTQFLIFTLFGDYVMPRGGKIWTGSLLYLMGLLGVSERAVRSTLSRMTRKGWIAPKKHGRRSRYSVTGRGQVLLEAGRRRIFEPAFSDWDGNWYLVMYSLPERKRKRRHALRTRLTWLGFGQLAPGTWISAHDRRSELEAFFDDLEVEANVDMFSGSHLGPPSAQELVHRCWDLEGLEAQYQEFIDRYQPEYQRRLEDGNGQNALCHEECFVRRFWLTHEFQSFPLRDPNLPTVLLEEDWAGFTARQLFDDYRQLLGTFAGEFVTDVINGNGYTAN